MEQPVIRPPLDEWLALDVVPVLDLGQTDA